MVDRMLRPQALNKRSWGDKVKTQRKPYSYGLTADLTHVHFLWPSPPPYLQLMPDRVAVSIQVQDQGVLLSDGAGVVGHTAHAQTALHLHTFVKQWLKTHPPATPVTQQTWLVRGCLPGRSAWTSPSVRSDRRASSRPDWGWRKPQTAAWRATPVDKFTLTVNAAQNANANTQTAWLHFVALYLWHDVMRLKSESLPTPALVLASTLWTFRNYLILGIDSKNHDGAIGFNRHFAVPAELSAAHLKCHSAVSPNHKNAPFLFCWVIVTLDVIYSQQMY